MTSLSDNLRHMGRVAYEAPMFVLLIPFYFFHEAAHAIATLPWGGPNAAYIIFDRAEEGVLAHIPVGAAIFHDPYDEWLPDVVVALAPLVLIAPGYVLFHAPSLVVNLVGGAMFLAGIGGATDLIYVVNTDFYKDLLIGSDFEYIRVVDFTAFGFGGEEPPVRAWRDEIED